MTERPGASTTPLLLPAASSTLWCWRGRRRGDRRAAGGRGRGFYCSTPSRTTTCSEGPSAPVVSALADGEFRAAVEDLAAARSDAARGRRGGVNLVRQALARTLHKEGGARHERASVFNTNDAWRRREHRVAVDCRRPFRRSTLAARSSKAPATLRFVFAEASK